MIRLDEKLRKRNERLMQKLQAWGELLNAAGWCVAVDWQGSGFWLSENAERDLKANGDVPPIWLDVMDRVPAELIHHRSEEMLIWSGRSVVSAMPELMINLSRRESEVLSWLREGKNGPEIAIILGCAIRTVEKHLANLYQKLGVRNRAAVILKVSDPIS